MNRASASSLVLLFAAALSACASSATAPGTSEPGTGGLNEDAGTSTAPKGSWTYVYSTYFGPGTPGHCGNSGCHSATRAGVRCDNQEGCYQTLLSSGLVDPAKGEASKIASASSALVWFNARGAMPRDNRKANDAAAADMREWLAAGAPND